MSNTYVFSLIISVLLVLYPVLLKIRVSSTLSAPYSHPNLSCLDTITTTLDDVSEC